MPGESEIRAGKAYVEITAKDALSAILDRIGAKFEAFGSALSSAGKYLSVAAAAVTAPMLALAYETAAASLELQAISQTTGFTVESLSELRYAAKQSGTEFEVLQTGLARMNNLLTKAAEGNQQATDTLDALNLSVADLTHLSPEERFDKIADAIGQIADPTLQAGLAIQVFGRHGATLLPMIRDGAAGLQKWREEAKRFNLVQSTESVQAGAAFQNSLNLLQAVLGALGRSIASAIIPILQRNVDLFTRVAVAVTDSVKKHQDLIATIFRVASVVGVLGAGLFGLGTAFSAVGKGISEFSGVASAALSFLISPVGLLLIGVAALGTYLVYASGTGGAALQYLRRLFVELKGDATAALKGIGDALSGANWSLAAAIAWNGLKIEWNRGITALADAVTNGVGPIGGAVNRLLTLIGDLTSPFLAKIGASWSGIGNGLGEGLLKAAGIAVFAFSAMEAATTHWRDLLHSAIAGVELRFISLWEDVKDWGIKAFDYIVGSFQSKFESMMVKVFAKVTDFFASMMELGGKYLNPLGTAAAAGIRAGAKSKLAGYAPLPTPGAPTYGARPKTANEQSLEAEQAAAQGSYSADLAKLYAQNKASFDGAMKDVSAAIKALEAAIAGGIGGAGSAAGKALEDLKKQRDDLLDQAAKGANNIAPPAPPHFGDFDLGEQASQGAISAAGTFNPAALRSLAGGDDTQKRTADATEKTAINTSNLLAAIAQGLPMLFGV